jgi:hypothetical protein
MKLISPRIIFTKTGSSCRPDEINPFPKELSEPSGFSVLKEYKEQGEHYHQQQKRENDIKKPFEKVEIDKFSHCLHTGPLKSVLQVKYHDWQRLFNMADIAGCPTPWNNKLRRDSF